MHKLIITNRGGEFSLNLRENRTYVAQLPSVLSKDISQLSKALAQIAPLDMLTIELPAIANEDEVKTLLGIIESIPFCNCIKLELPCFRSDTTNNIDVEITKQAIIYSILFLQLKTSNLDLSGPSRIGFFQGSLSDFASEYLQETFREMLYADHIKSLNLSSNKLSKFGAEKLEEILGYLPVSLKYLNLSSNNLSKYDAEGLAEILGHLPGGLKLNLFGNSLSSKGDKYLADILKLLPDSVEVALDLEKEFFQLLMQRNSSAKFITRLQRFVDVWAPEVSMMPAYKGVIPAFHALGKVVEIDLSRQLSSLEDDCLATVGKVIAENFPKVRILDLSNNDLGKKATKKTLLLKIIKELPKNITHINLSNNGLDEDTLSSVLAELSSNVGEGVNIKVNVSGNIINSIRGYDNIEIVNLNNQCKPSDFFNPASQIRQYEIITWLILLNEISDMDKSAEDKIKIIKAKLAKLQQCDYVVLEGNPFELNNTQLSEVVSHLPNSIKAITFKGNPWAAYSMQQWQNLFGVLKKTTIFDQTSASSLAQITIDLSQLNIQKKFTDNELNRLEEMFNQKGYCAKFSNDDNENKKGPGASFRGHR